MQVSMGSGKIFGVRRGRAPVLHSAFNNTVVYEGIDLLGLILGGRDYTINTVYIEFNNGGALSVTADPTEGRSYYADLESDGNADHGYLRVPIIGSPTLASSDSEKFLTNRVTFNAITSGSTGLRGASDFSFSAASTVFGIALVAAPDADDPASDLVFSRSYDFTSKVKLANEEVALQWSHVFPEEISSSSSS